MLKFSYGANSTDLALIEIASFDATYLTKKVVNGVWWDGAGPVNCVWRSDSGEEVELPAYIFTPSGFLSAKFIRMARLIGAVGLLEFFNAAEKGQDLPECIDDAADVVKWFESYMLAKINK